MNSYFFIALRFEQISPLAVQLYSFGTQFVQSALFSVHPKRLVFLIRYVVLFEPVDCVCKVFIILKPNTAG